MSDVLIQRERAQSLQSAAFKRHEAAVEAAGKDFVLARSKIQHEHDTTFNRARQALQIERHRQPRCPQGLADAEAALKAAAARPAPSFAAAEAERQETIQRADTVLRDTLNDIRRRLERNEITE